MGKARKVETKFSTDSLMRNLASALVRDFQRGLQDFSFCCSFLASLRSGSVAEVRESTPTVDFLGDSKPYKFKVTYQLASIFKRHRFHADIYSDQELTEKAISTFLETQDRLRALDLTCAETNTQAVIDYARRYVAKVLGPYDGEEHRSLCRFGKKASVGVPSRLACEAARWELPLSGSPEQISWFDSEMSQNFHVQNYWARQLESDPSRSIYQETSSLTLVLVPKTFKSLRAIMPNTTIGSYMSFGLGEMMRVRLLRKGYDLRKLQHLHRSYAQAASRTGLYVTADLSSASDSISVDLVRRLLPPDWFEVLEQSRIGNVTLPNGQIVESQTFCTMGIGYTFPLQTLVFLALLKAVEAVHFRAVFPAKRDRRRISVYGDDMIYAARMHKFVLLHFKALGFVINIDKTYHEGHFRESCGGDFYHGVDVRPFQPQNGSVIVGSKAYEATLYKCINGLLMRWDECEIGEALSYLTSELETVAGTVKRVPADFPDDSGVKCPRLDSWDFLKSAKVAALKYLGHGNYRFPFLSIKNNLRKEDRHDPYFWLATRRHVEHFVHLSNQHCQPDVVSPYFGVLFEHLVGLPERRPLLITKDAEPIQTFRSKISGRRLRRQVTYVQGTEGHYTRQSGISCFGIRS